MAERDYAPDEGSDHDFLVITRTGAQEELRRDLSWLPDPGDVRFSFRETAHGLKVLYRSGHLLEFAVFDLDELWLAAINRYRVLLDRGGVEERVAAVVARPWEREPDGYLVGQVVTNAVVATGRARRGEELSAAFFVVTAARRLATLLARHVPSPERGLLDEFDPFRRFERVYPELGAELAEALRLPAADGAARMVAILERELPDVLEAVGLEQP